MTPGEKKDVVVTFPEEYHAEDLAGKEAVFHCLVHEISEEQLPELDDDSPRTSVNMIHWKN